MNIRFSPHPYVASHGRNPSGRGSWAFSLMRNPANVLTQVFFAPGGLTLTEAKTHARSWAAAEGERLGMNPAGILLVFIQP
jgi:hypothetical protein